MKVAIVCDWLTNTGGAEKVLLAIHEMFPKAPIFTSKYDKRGIDWFDGADVRTGWLQIFPSGMRRFLAPLRQLYFSHLDLSSYDLVISVTGAEAKSVKTGDAFHICYCHVPTQYYWQMYESYLADPGFGKLNFLARFGLKLLVKPLRKADFKAAQRPDCFVTISSHAAEQIAKYYEREAVIVAPPVETDKFRPQKDASGDYYINFSRQVSWKRQDLIVRACITQKRKLLMIGEGPEHENLKRIANGSPLVEFLPWLSSEELNQKLAGAKAFIFPSLEPFGIAPVEALSAGCPVITFAEGGARDFVIDGENGVLFKKQSVKSLEKAILRFEGLSFSSKKVAKSAEKFAKEEFLRKMKELIDEKMAR